MKSIDITCAHCGVSFPKVLKEYNRQIKKNPEYRFYCSLRCSGKESFLHLDVYSFSHRPEEQRLGCKQAKIVNTKYIGEDRYFREYIRRAEMRKHECSLTIPYLKTIWAKQRGRCAISNIPLSHVTTTTNHIYQASLDRIDGKKGYVVGNVQFLSCSINLAKNSMTDMEAHALLQAICENYLHRDTNGAK